MKFEIKCRYKKGVPVETPELTLVEKFLDFQGHEYDYSEGDALEIYRNFRSSEPHFISSSFVGLVLWFNYKGYVRV